MSTVKKEEPAEEPKKEPEAPKVEVHIHNAPSFNHQTNSADVALDRMTGDGRRKWMP